ncbi:zinc finger protein 835 [Marmota marmota marmota]|uniref:zinc finger protein 835 n=1 Tax=Marmota marmota marmota TaxID=9994 RepID=UPI00209278E0|nr:zinc finger protein 835 [Marmota marmota marmota]XP_048647558.1 zinc finger protein 835 [Marmota marmota marmota]
MAATSAARPSAGLLPGGTLAHTPEKPYGCGDCTKAFRRFTHLTQHRRVRTGEQPCACVQCAQAFRNRLSLMEHQHIHRGEKPFEGAQCAQAFRFSSGWSATRDPHRGEAILLQQRAEAFQQIAHPAQQRRTHTHTHTEQPYVCLSASLAEHQRIHTGEKPAASVPRPSGRCGI